jgi:hypothetical protein
MQGGSDWFDFTALVVAAFDFGSGIALGSVASPCRCPGLRGVSLCSFG